MYSSENLLLKTLATGIDIKKADSFLIEMLNLLDTDPRAMTKFRNRFSGWLPLHVGVLDEAAEEMGANTGMMSKVLDARDALRQAWIKPTALEREIGILGVIVGYAHQKSRTHLQLDPFVVALVRALHRVDFLRRCANPDCPAPYFIAKKRSSKYCTDTCALPAQREFKRAWWKDHGKEWRKIKARSKTKGSRATHKFRKG